MSAFDDYMLEDVERRKTVVPFKPYRSKFRDKPTQTKQEAMPAFETYLAAPPPSAVQVEQVPPSPSGAPGPEPAETAGFDNQALLEHMARFEDFRPDAYFATDEEKKNGVVTIGYGTTGRYKIGDTITQEKALELKLEDIKRKTAEARKWEGFDQLPVGYQNVVIDLVYNGGSGLVGPRAKAAIKAGDLDSLLRETLDTASQTEGGVKKTMIGLAKRRAAAYNQVAKVKIKEVEQTAGGRIRYLGADGKEIFAYGNARHSQSTPGRVSVDSP